MSICDAQADTDDDSDDDSDDDEIDPEYIDAEKEIREKRERKARRKVLFDKRQCIKMHYIRRQWYLFSNAFHVPKVRPPAYPR